MALTMIDYLLIVLFVVPGMYEISQFVSRLRAAETINQIPESNTFIIECGDVLSVIPDLPDEDEYHMKLYRNCQERFHDLLMMHKNNHESISRRDHFQYHFHSDSKLLVLDLDETVMDQSTFMLPLDDDPYPDYAAWANDQDLVMNINHFQSRFVNNGVNGPRKYSRKYSTEIWVGIFRRYLMELIQFCEQNGYDIMLYSKAAPDPLMFQAVTIESYYNFVYAYKGFNFDHWFRFKSVLGRSSNDVISASDHRVKDSKSMFNIQRVMKENQYSNVVIVDDLGDKVWDKTIPEEYYQEDISILCFQTTPFTFDGWRGVHEDRIRIDNGMIDDVKEERRSDVTFLRLINTLRKKEKKRKVGKDSNWGKETSALVWKQI